MAIVATPDAVGEVRARLLKAGVPQEQVEVAELRVTRHVDRSDRAPLVFVPRHPLLGAALLGAVGLLIGGARSGLGLELVLAGAGGAVVGAVLGLAASLAQQLAGVGSATVERRFWKVRVEGDATVLARARGLASRTGRTLRRVVTGAFEVKPRGR